MRRRMRLPSDRHERGQSALEYALFIAVVSAALITMQVYVRRSIQANLKALEDRTNAEALPAQQAGK